MTSPPLTLREATPADFPAIVRLVPSREELFYVYPKGRYPFSEDQLHALAASRHALTVALRDGTVAGFANLYDVQPGRWAYIGNVIVAPARRGQGIGRALVSHMIHRARDEYGVAEVRISVFRDNTPALLLYAGLDFLPYALEQRQDPAGRSVPLLHLRLRGGDTPPVAGD